MIFCQFDDWWETFLSGCSSCRALHRCLCQFVHLYHQFHIIWLRFLCLFQMYLSLSLMVSHCSVSWKEEGHVWSEAFHSSLHCFNLRTHSSVYVLIRSYSLFVLILMLDDISIFFQSSEYRFFSFFSFWFCFQVVPNCRGTYFRHLHWSSVFRS